MQLIEKPPSNNKQKSSAEQRILTVFAWRGPTCKYELWNKLKVASRRTVDGDIKRLKEKGAIVETKSLKMPYLPVVKRYYKLTTFGLFSALMAEDVWEQIDHVAKKYRAKLLIFRKWRYFDRHEVLGEVIMRLQGYFHQENFTSGIYMRPPWNKFQEITRVTDLNHYVLFPFFAQYQYEHFLPEVSASARFYYKLQPTCGPEEENWIRMLLGDEDLRRYLMTELDRRIKWCKKSLSDAMFWKMKAEKYPSLFHRARLKRIRALRSQCARFSALKDCTHLIILSIFSSLTPSL